MFSCRACYLLTCLCFPLFAEVGLAGQAIPAPEQRSSIEIHKRVEEVRVLFNVTDRHGRPVTGLKAEDVIVLEDGQPVSSFTDFSLPVGMPLRLTMLVDASASMAGNFSAEREAAQRMLSAGSDPDPSAAAWASFSAEPRKSWRAAAVPPDSRFQPGSLSSLRATGQTAVLDALSFAMQHPPSRWTGQPGRNVILLLSDGEDNSSRHTLAEIVATAQQEEIAIYAVAAHSSRLEFPGDRMLRSLCEGTGGRFFLVPDYSKTDSALEQIKSDLKSEYAVSFRPRARRGGTGGAHSLAITIRNRRGLRVQARKGYFVGEAE